MSEIKGRVGKREITWRSVPSGRSGSAYAEVEGKLLEVRWKRDSQGIWIELPDAVHGFDIEGVRADHGGLSYRVEKRGAPGAWSELAFSRAGDEAAGATAGGEKRGVRVRAQMPGKIIRVLVKAGAVVEKDQALLVMEAMKMENEIKASQPGKISQLKVAEGEAVETGADLCRIEPL